MALTPKDIADILIKEDYITQKDAEKILPSVKNESQFIDSLLSNDLITKDLFGQAMAESYGVPYADLNTTIPSQEQIKKIPKDLAKKHKLVLFRDSSEHTIVATDNPKKADEVLSELKEILKVKNVTFAYSLLEDIKSVFIHYRKTLETRFVKIIESQKRVAPEIVDEIVADALAYHASDIHFEPQEKELLVRFRVDGILQEAGRVDKQYYDNILNRIKVLAKLRTDEHQRAQDGAIRYRGKDEASTVDVRVSIAPTLDGEKVVMRLLAEYVRRFTLNDLGLSVRDQVVMAEVAKKPFGMILAVGPTGSGKTTTMYSILKMLNSSEVNIATIEDPVEYKIPGVNHIQVNPTADITFARGLRSIARQDPDVILVGEIRDTETAEIAVNAALTGHLMLSTFHANDAATAIPRLLDMGVEPFLLASTLEVIIAERLVRRICDHCRLSRTVDRKEIEKNLPNSERFFPDEQNTIYKGKGCATCNDTGYKGRIALFELIHVTPAMKELILKEPSVLEIQALAKEQGAHTLFDDGIDKVKSGITTLEEVRRVVAPPKI